MDNRRKTIVVNKKFQHQYALLFVAMTVLLTNIFIVVRSLFPGENPLGLTGSMALAVGLMELVLVIGVWYWSLKASLKIAGPVYVFSRQLKLIGGGDFTSRISLRDGDMFQVEAGEINASLDELQGRVEAVKVLGGQLQGARDAGEDLAPHVDRLVTELAALRTEKEE